VSDRPGKSCNPRRKETQTHGLGQASNQVNRGIAHPTLQRTDVGVVDTSRKGQPSLRQMGEAMTGAGSQ
jgi:hypothetical protein